MFALAVEDFPEIIIVHGGAPLEMKKASGVSITRSVPRPGFGQVAPDACFEAGMKGWLPPLAENRFDYCATCATEVDRPFLTVQEVLGVNPSVRVDV